MWYLIFELPKLFNLTLVYRTYFQTQLQAETYKAKHPLLSGFTVVPESTVIAVPRRLVIPLERGG